MSSSKNKWIVGLSIIAVLSIASTVAILRSQPPRFEDRFRKVAVRIPDRQSVDGAIWLDDDNVLFIGSTPPLTAYRISLSQRRVTVDAPLTRAIAQPELAPRIFDGVASPDGK